MQFTDGFTEKSYFAIVKQAIIGIYESLGQFRSENGFDFFYDDTEEVNASASIGKTGKDCVTINVQTLISIFNYSKSVFSNPMLFEEIGDSRVEKGGMVHGRYSVENCQLLFSGTPSNPIREKMSTLVAIIMLRFIATHELGHLYNGHLKLIEEYFGIVQS